MTQVLSFLNLQQGGGKTTTVLNLATALKRRGHNVLAVDLAAEGCLSHRIQFSNPTRTLRQVGMERSAKIVSTREGWHLMPAAVSMALLHRRTMQRLNSGTDFNDELRSLFDAYDYVLADCSTFELSLISEMLALSDEVIVPLDSESLQFHDAVDRLYDLFAAHPDLNPHLKFGGVFLAHYVPQIRRAREILTRLFTAFGPVNCFSAYLRESSEIRQAEQRRASVIQDAPTSQAAHTFFQLADQLTETSVPRLQTPTLMVTPGRVMVKEEEIAPAPPFEPVYAFMPDGLPTWRQRAENTSDFIQAVRYAVLSMLEQPESPAALELFESRLTGCIESATYPGVNRLVELGEFLGEHELDHYAAQLLRRATELDPAHLSAWAALARVSQIEDERKFAMEQCLGLDQGLAAAEAPEPPRRPAARLEPSAFASSFGTMQPASA